MSRGRPADLGLRRVLGRLSPYALQERRVLAGSLAALLASIALRLLEPWPLKLVFDHVIDSRGRRPALLPGWLGPSSVDPMLLLAGASIAVIAVTALRAFAQYLNKVGFASMGNRVLARLRADVFRHLQRLSLTFHTASRSGDLVLRVIQDVNLLRDVAVTAILPLTASALVLVGMWVVMFWMQWKLALLSTAALPLLWLYGSRMTLQIREVGRKQRRRQGELAATAAESVAAIKDVQALALEGVFQDEFAASNRSSGSHDVRGAKLTASLGRWVDVLLAAATAMVLYYGALLIRRSELSPGELLVFLTYLRRAFNPIQDFAKYSSRLAKAAAAGERILELLEREPAIRDLPGAVEAPRCHGWIRFEEVCFAYEPGRPVLAGASFEIGAGQHAVLVGPSGAGKSTIADLLLRFYEPQAGRVLIDGRDIREFTLASLRRQLSMVLQDSLLFATTVRENIARGAPGCSDAEVEEAARLAMAHEFIANLPHGYDTVIGERGATLSGGQRQRLAIARAAVRKTPILICDEPTAGLDEESRQAVLEALERLSRGRTVLTIAHDLEVCGSADLVLSLVDGSIAEQGTHRELVARGGQYAALYRLQSEGRWAKQGRIRVHA